jgi:hypothetical protein
MKNKNLSFKLYNLKTHEVSKKTWKTYKGAQRNYSHFAEVVIPNHVDILQWLEDNPCPNLSSDYVHSLREFLDYLVKSKS